MTMEHPDTRPDADLLAHRAARQSGDDEVLVAYRDLGKPEPPPEVRDRVLARARTRPGMARLPAWRLAASAAVLAVGAALVFNAGGPAGTVQEAATLDEPAPTGTMLRPAPGARDPRATASAKPGADRGPDRTPDSPEAWLARLEVMQRAGDDKAFRLELKRFGETYPEHLETARQRLGMVDVQ